MKPWIRQALHRRAASMPADVVYKYALALAQEWVVDPENHAATKDVSLFLLAQGFRFCPLCHTFYFPPKKSALYVEPCSRCCG